MKKNEEKNLESFGYKQELKRTLTLKDLIIYGLIFMVPIAPFGIYGEVVTASKGMIVLTYLIGMIAMLFTAISYGSMSEAFPIAGSVYAYAQRGINKTIGFLAGWMILLDYVFVPSLLYVVSANSLKAILPSIPVWIWLILFILVNSIINIRGVMFTAKANIIFLIGELIVLAVFIAFGLVAISNGAGNGLTLKPIYDATEFNLPFVMTAVSVAVLSFLGFDGISTLAEETKGGNKVVGKAILWSLLIVGSLFIIQTYVAAIIHPDYTVFNSIDTAFYEIAGEVGGTFLKNVTIIATILSWGFANALAAQAAISRVLFGMARDKNLPSILAKIHPKYKTPYISTLLVALVSIIVGLMFVNNVGILSSIVNCGALTAFLVIHISVIYHFIIKQKSKRYIVHLIVPIIGFLIIAYVMINLDLLAKTIGLVWLVIGIIYYIIMRLMNRNIEIKEIE
ncbi:APC family permease [Enterococcus sp. ALS3]|uniref:APC family permease n=1 Tax=Enterococcus alishanensis TaxID=1303817 RepID=A0ABS6THJ2_9ENTE|nr:APC family permease [Enterococcus alishanensis]MBV7392376.1 APC family permease [Enterococcus alishanensis]